MIKTNLEHWKQFEKDAKSTFNIVGQLDWFNSLLFEVNNETFFVIGLDSEDQKTFTFLYYKNEELIKQEYSKAPEQLDIWLQEINKTSFKNPEPLILDNPKPF